jgi:hypothetical protein
LVVETGQEVGIRYAVSAVTLESDLKYTIPIHAPTRIEVATRRVIRDLIILEVGPMPMFSHYI